MTVRPASALSFLALVWVAVPRAGLAQSPLGMSELARAKSMLELYRAQLSAEQFSLLGSKLAQTEQAYVELTTVAEASGEAAAVAAESGAAAQAATSGGRAILGGVAELLPLLIFVWPSTAHAPGMKEEKPEVRAARAKLAKSVEELTAAARRVQDEQAAAAKRTKRKRVVLDDDTPCHPVGGFDAREPIRCSYRCDGVADAIEIELPRGMRKCPGEDGAPLKWKDIRGFPQRL